MVRTGADSLVRLLARRVDLLLICMIEVELGGVQGAVLVVGDEVE